MASPENPANFRHYALMFLIEFIRWPDILKVFSETQEMAVLTAANSRIRTGMANLSPPFIDYGSVIC